MEVMSYNDQLISSNGKAFTNLGGAVTDTLPIGSITLFGSSIAPTGWLMCNGQAVDRLIYSELFDAIGTTFGAGDGSTTFNVPNYTNRFPVGAGDDYDMGDTGGEATHTLTIDEMPSHSHYLQGSDILISEGLQQWGIYQNPTGGVSSAARGGNQPHNNLPPYLAINYIIKAK